MFSGDVTGEDCLRLEDRIDKYVVVPLVEWPILMSCALGDASGSKLMRMPFSGRNQKLETMNRILTEAAQQRTERIEELERQAARLQQELEAARKAIHGAKVFEVAAAERAHLLNKKDEELTVVREALIKCKSRIEELERTLAENGQK
jgi:predicted RNase H-like nuclease (RuvC/YqgF family)